MLPDEPNSTLRERMRVTRQDYCWTCHKKMDPLGLPFESYNHTGLFRLEEQKKPVDATGEIIDSGDPSLGGKVENAIEMIQKIARSRSGRNSGEFHYPKIVFSHSVVCSSRARYGKASDVSSETSKAHSRFAALIIDQSFKPPKAAKQLFLCSTSTCLNPTSRRQSIWNISGFGESSFSM